MNARGRRTQRRQAEHRELGIEEARRQRAARRPNDTLASIPLARPKRRRRR